MKTCGIRFSLDDFGTGFSSLIHLRRMPLDQLKIDQSFVSEVGSNANDAAIAEGVETEEQRSFLAINGCKSYQGFLFGRPASVDSLERMIRKEAATLH